MTNGMADTQNELFFFGEGDRLSRCRLLMVIFMCVMPVIVVVIVVMTLRSRMVLMHESFSLLGLH